MTSALGTPVKGGVKAPPQSSATQNTSVGSGSRPGSVKMPIESSAPMDARTLDRDPPRGWLGSGSESRRQD
jgi:hypothetical protein